MQRSASLCRTETQNHWKYWLFRRLMRFLICGFSVRFRGRSPLTISPANLEIREAVLRRMRRLAAESSRSTWPRKGERQDRRAGWLGALHAPGRPGSGGLVETANDGSRRATACSFSGSRTCPAPVGGAYVLTPQVVAATACRCRAPRKSPDCRGIIRSSLGRRCGLYRGLTNATHHPRGADCSAPSVACGAGVSIFGCVPNSPAPGSTTPLVRL